MKSKLPPISSKARKSVREAFALYYETCATALKRQSIGDFLQQELLSNQNELVRSAEINFTMYWIPTPEELKITASVVDKDPFIAAELFGRNYLIARWDVKGEKPFEHYLKEFSEK